MLFALILLILSGLLVVIALRMRHTTGIPWTRIVGSDSGGGKPFDQPLFARRYGLTGRPDYLLEQANAYIPVEVKPGRRAMQPYESDLAQVAAYCLLVEETMECSPPYGLLRYANATFRVSYTPSVRNQLLDTLEAMRLDLESDDCARSHNNPRRCEGCGFVEVCEEALVDGQL
jgi:CRISPR-associated exonuclease Cas4